MSKRKSTKKTHKISSEKKSKVFAILVGLIFFGSVLGAGAYYSSGSSYGGDNVHRHADFAIFINGQQLSLDHSNFYEGGINKNYHLMDIHTGYPNTLHMHPQLVSLDGFFKSVGIRLTNDCIAFGTEEFCTNETHSLKFYVNGEPNGEVEDYVFEDLDSIMISYGPIDEDISEQIAYVNSLQTAEAASRGEIAG